MFLFLFILLNGVVKATSNEFKGPPEDVSLIWQGDKMTVQSTKAQFYQNISDDCFQIVLQLKSNNAMEWQRTMISSSSGCYLQGMLFHCTFYNPNLDPEKCFQIQIQFQTAKICTYIFQSEWSRTIFTKNGSLLDSCAEVVMGTSQTPMVGVKNSFVQRHSFIISLSTISCLVLFVIISFGCGMGRVKKCLFPVIPDPKNVFSDLFDLNSGYIQEWIKTLGSETQQEDVQWDTDGQHEEQISIYMKENEIVMPENQHDIEAEEETVTASASLMENVSEVCLGDMNFIMNESMYIIL
ncbi:cytokine receptor-like factor 2 [Mixophyes fleayi]|uniref:cytokine receptor-like factor 2 n=1 Tax=Mixophyes fleayi TaxID=3061075 RepID=UPI003F4DAEC4